jgi:excinuclease ABC subunit B
VTGQVDDLVHEIKLRVERGERALVTTLTKRMAEDLSSYLGELGMKVNYLHSEVETLERVGILRDLRMGVFDVVVGINLLREGLDLPEVSLVAILDADKQGFLRSETALVQTIGRAARHVHGKVIMYADNITDAMKSAIDETNRRRAKQEKYNQDHNIRPVSIIKEIYDITERLTGEMVRDASGAYDAESGNLVHIPKDALQKLIEETEQKMQAAAKELDFERAAVLRDQIYELRRILVEESNVAPWKKAMLLAGEEEEED